MVYHKGLGHLHGIFLGIDDLFQYAHQYDEYTQANEEVGIRQKKL